MSSSQDNQSGECISKSTKQTMKTSKSTKDIVKVPNNLFDRSKTFFDQFALSSSYIPKYQVSITSDYELNFGSNIDPNDDLNLIKSLINRMNKINPIEYSKLTNQIEKSIVYVYLLPLIHENKYCIKFGYTKDEEMRYNTLLASFGISKMILLFAYKIKCEAYEEAAHTFIKSKYPDLHFLTEKKGRAKTNLEDPENIEYNKFCKETYVFDIKIFQVIMDIIKEQSLPSINEGKLLDLKIAQEKTKQIQIQEEEKTKQMQIQEKTKQEQEKTKQIELELKILQLKLQQK